MLITYCIACLVLFVLKDSVGGQKKQVIKFIFKHHGYAKKTYHVLVAYFQSLVLLSFDLLMVILALQ